VHSHIHHTPFPSSDFLFEGEAYDLPWNNRRDSLVPGKTAVPSIDHAIFLVNTVKFHCTQLFHLFDEEEFNAKLQAFYADTRNTSGTDLWYVHFLLVVALGKALAQNNLHGLRPPGSEFFQEAQQLLPDTDTLCRDPIVSMELLCCAALYLHALDSRNAAHVTVCSQILRSFT
jgi:proline utilization trans-activator